MKVDLHVHTNFSDCSSLSYEMVREYVEREMPQAITVTDHGTIKACRRLSQDFPELCVLWGIEVTAKEGDFLIYSTDLDYLASLGVFHASVDCLRRDDQTALFWAHPRMPPPPDGHVGPAPLSEETLHVARHVDGLELFNGTMLDLARRGSVRPHYFEWLQRIVAAADLACVGGSDAHEPESFFSCWTVFADDAATPAQMVTALKRHQVSARFDAGRFGGLLVPVLPAVELKLSNG